MGNLLGAPREARKRWVQASPYWEIAAGYVGAMRAEIPFTSLYSQAVSLTLDETLITIRPRSTPLKKKAPQASSDRHIPPTTLVRIHP